MADYKPDSVHTCKAHECEPLVKDGPHWFEHHMACWICNRDNNRADMVWHDGSTTYFHELCILERAREQAMAACEPCSSLRLLMVFRHACTALRQHRQAIARQAI